MSLEYEMNLMRDKLIENGDEELFMYWKVLSKKVNDYLDILQKEYDFQRSYMYEVWRFAMWRMEQGNISPEEKRLLNAISYYNIDKEWNEQFDEKPVKDWGTIDHLIMRIKNGEK